jgi:cAMP-binding proteins - catabolite gene activator and regulatory subunit of cAMP-dependent protein kinases
MEREYKILAQAALFKGMEEEEIESVLGCLGGQAKNYGKNQFLIQAGTRGFTSLGIVLGGSVQIIKEDITGNRMIIAVMEEGEIFGETFACVGMKQTFVSVVSSEESRVLWFPMDRIISPCSKVCGFHSRLIANLLEILARKNLFLNQKMELLSKRTIRDKIMSFLILQMEESQSRIFDIPFNRNEMADYLCIDRSAMSRELGNLKREGILDFHRNTFKVLIPVKSDKIH